jgi:hypothetical protein
MMFLNDSGCSKTKIDSTLTKPSTVHPTPCESSDGINNFELVGNYLEKMAMVVLKKSFRAWITLTPWALFGAAMNS